MVSEFSDRGLVYLDFLEHEIFANYALKMQSNVRHIDINIMKFNLLVFCSM